MTATLSNGARPKKYRDFAHRLREIEIIESLLEFDLPSLQFYSDSVADERQFLSQLLSGRPRKIEAQPRK